MADHLPENIATPTPTEQATPAVPGPASLVEVVEAAAAAAAVEVDAEGVEEVEAEKREVLFGFPPVHTFYSLRAMAASLLEKTIGEADTQKVLAHAVGSKTFRNHYDVSCNHIDFLGILKENGNALENGTARELNVVLRGDFQTAKANIGIPSDGALSKEELRLFVDEYEQQAADLDQRTIDERKQALGKCGLMLWFGRDRPGYNMRYVFVDGMVRLTRSTGEPAATADELHESLKMFKSADFSAGLEMKIKAASAKRAICTADEMQGRPTNEPHIEAMESASTAHDNEDNGAVNQSADQLAPSFGLESKAFCPKIPARLNRKQNAPKNIDTKSGEGMAASFALAANMLDANSPSIPRGRMTGRPGVEQSVSYQGRLEFVRATESCKFLTDEDVESVLSALRRQECSNAIQCVKPRKAAAEGGRTLSTKA
ncbi:hypothetical protein PRZ48_007103 [Zasmidium cellare]|uniref:Uncharacterized protein n=1 Tax=Zasmidium cellare TaxID=395010 RepID=A0ABR0EJ85_ZASCE|nr:hypothetical protein PRZ48_007103 [Zasmidium cellare]